MQERTVFWVVWILDDFCHYTPFTERWIADKFAKQKNGRVYLGPNTKLEPVEELS